MGANTGYFGIRLAEEFASVATLVDDWPALTGIVAAQENPRLSLIGERLDTAGLNRLPRHDVVLALSVLHHFADWRSALAALRACRRCLIVETPHPAERWMRHAPARHELGELHKAVRALGELIHSSKRVGRDGRTYTRPTYVLKGSVMTFTGDAFTGSGSCSRKLPEQTDLGEHLGYEPFPGSLNLRWDGTLGAPKRPAVDYVGPKGRDYQFWRAWVGDIACHVMVPGKRGWPNSVELVAPVKLRDALGVEDGDTLTVDVAS